MTKAQEKLRKDIEGIEDEAVIENVRSFIMGMFAQQEIGQVDRKGKQAMCFRK